jgi:hypothetical protein
MINHSEAQELSQCIGQGIERDGDYMMALERAREIAGVLVSDTMNDREAKALAIVLEAAEKWRDELGQEIIPEADDNDAEGYQGEHDRIDAAITVLRGEVEPGQVVPHDAEPTSEFEEKRRELAAFLYELYHGKGTWAEVLLAPLYDDRYGNYMADADDVLRANPHLLTLETLEQMGIDH